MRHNGVVNLKKDLEYYMKLNYPLEVIQVPEDEGGGFIITIPALGRASMNAHGETFEEALTLLNEIKKESFARWLDEGLPIPDPADETDEEYSGRFVLRIPKFLHRMLAERAERENVSLNSLINTLLTLALSEANTVDKVKDMIKAVFKDCIREAS